MTQPTKTHHRWPTPPPRERHRHSNLKMSLPTTDIIINLHHKRGSGHRSAPPLLTSGTLMSRVKSPKGLPEKVEPVMGGRWVRVGWVVERSWKSERGVDRDYWKVSLLGCELWWHCSGVIPPLIQLAKWVQSIECGGDRCFICTLPLFA